MTRCYYLAVLFLGLGSVGLQADTHWWSFQPMVKPAVTSPLSSIDYFVQAQLAERGLTPAEEADKRTLVRRLYYNVIGLPPEYEVVEAFVNDDDPEAYAKLVDQLLASTQYGERWARHWLDVVHYGETHGYDKDKLRPNAYPYRDYVIRALNEDKPYAQFVKEQLAGDALYPHTVDGIVATGFIAAGPWDFIGHAEVPEEKTDGKIARHLDRDDMVTTTLNAFCSLTVQCAQCHDHKGDPVTMKNYYALQSVFAALDRADRLYDTDPIISKQRTNLSKQLALAKSRIVALEGKLKQHRTEELRTLEVSIATATKASDRLGYHSLVASKQSVEKWVQVDFGSTQRIDEIVLAGANEYGFADFGFPHRYRVEISDKSNFKQATVLVNHKADQARPGSVEVRINGNGTIGRYVRVTASKLWNRRQKGQPKSTDWIFALGELGVVADGQSVAIEGITALDSIETGERWGKANLIAGVPRVDLSALRAQRQALLIELAPDVVAALKDQRAALAAAQEAFDALPKPQKVYAGTVHNGCGAFKGRGHVNGEPRPIHVLHRGDVNQPRDAVMPGTVSGIVRSLPTQFELAQDSVESDRRVALAEWIVHPDNTLTWRSIVNRVWHYHFGRGIVDTPNDFGRIGSKPSHPELLDWLAVTFRDGGGSIKDLHRLILNSAVYKQSSAHDEANSAIDSSNQFLWRQNRRRLEAEAIRDSVLVAAGKLDLTMYGPSFQDFVIEKPEHSPHYEYHKADPDDVRTHRRSIYRFLVRSQPQPFMDTLDCADPSELVDKRGETNTALQALAMLNNQFMVRMAEHFAKRLEGKEEPAARALRLALSRRPSPQERQTLEAYANQHGLAALCRLVFNLNEFSFVD